MHRHFVIHASNLTKIKFCDTEYYNTKGIYELPFPTNPTNGKHDYNECKGCQTTLRNFIINVNKKLESFPDCCEYHKNLKTLSYFNKQDFVRLADSIALKGIYARQHITNNLDKEDWYLDITNYLEYTIHSFGSFPEGFGEPFLFAAFLHDLLDFLNSNINTFPKQKIQKLIEFVTGYTTTKNVSKTDFNVLMSTYEKWLKIFPFELSFFKGAKEYFIQNIPILKSKPVYNPYLNISKAELQDKESLIKVLIERTNYLLTHINSFVLHEKGLINDPDSIKLEFVIKERKMKLEQGYVNLVKDEGEKYRKIIKEWFEDEKKFIDEIKPLLKNLESQKTQTKYDPPPDKISSIKNNFDRVSILEVFNHFKKGLIDKGFISEKELIEYIKQAFDKKIAPEILFRFTDVHSKQKVIKVFYDYYKNVAGKPHRQQTKYVELLSNYFEGYITQNVKTNFNK